MNMLLRATLLLITLAMLPMSVLAAPISSVPAVYQPLPKTGVKIPLDAGHYFTFKFDKSPKIGTSIAKVEIYTQGGKRDTSFVVKGDADMPSMRGAHSTGNKTFPVSTKGVYLLPLNFVMPGDWEVRLTFEKNAATVFRGAYLFDL